MQTLIIVEDAFIQLNGVFRVVSCNIWFHNVQKCILKLCLAYPVDSTLGRTCKQNRSKLIIFAVHFPSTP